MSDQLQPRLDLIPHDYRGEIIGQRAGDGYINATAMCKAAGRKFNDYARLGATGPFLAALAAETGIPATELIQSVSGGHPHLQGTWVHPQVSINLAQWASPRFAVLVSRWVVEWMTGSKSADRAWRVFNDRLDLVHDRVPEGYFCIFRETADIYASFIRGGIDPGLKIILDISVGSHWARHWKKEDLTAKFGPASRYRHDYPPYYSQSKSNPQAPLCYPEDALGTFKRWMREVYVRHKLPVYLNDQVRQKKISRVEATGAIAALEHRERSRPLPAPVV